MLATFITATATWMLGVSAICIIERQMSGEYEFRRGDIWFVIFAIGWPVALPLVAILDITDETGFDE